MNYAPDPNWKPDPQLLAAYFDGELDGRDDAANVRARVEAWLEEHPDAEDDCQPLRDLWLDTTPAEPSAAAWKHALAQIDARIDGRRKQPRTDSAPQRSWRGAAIMAACVALFFGLLFGALRSILPTSIKNDAVVVALPVKAGSEDEVFAVATADEVVVLHIQGPDISTLAVGQMPMQGPLELAAPGDIRVNQIRPDARDQMVPTVHLNGPRPPMIWAKLETD